MIMQIEYEASYTGKNYYFYDSEKETEEEARYRIMADSWSPNGFKVDAIEYEILKKLVEQVKAEAYEKGKTEGFIAGMKFIGGD